MSVQNPLRTRLRRMLGALLCAGAVTLAGSAGAQVQAPAPRPAIGPWGVSSSASAFRNHDQWFPKMSAAGVSTVRLFPGWRTFQPGPGQWRWDRGDELLDSAQKNGIEISAILMGSAPGSNKAHAFPMDNLDGWSAFVSGVVGRYGDRVQYWEVWNEGNGGFNDNHNTTADYANLAVRAYTAARNASPRAKVGLSVASFDAPYLNQAIRAMAEQGHPDSFDYLCIHPYELADGLDDPDGEIPFLWMTPMLRTMLATASPQRKDAPVWITEVGRRIERRGEHAVDEADAARTLVKIYTLAIAQGISRTEWFEAQDPAGEQPGFGLLRRDGTPRASYRAVQTMTRQLGPAPSYRGWLALGQDRRGYGFVFAGPASPVLVAWMPAGTNDQALSFARNVQVIDLAGGITRLNAGDKLQLGPSPLFVAGLPDELVQQAKRNARMAFPWGGDYTKATAVSCRPGDPDRSDGLFRRGRQATPSIRFPDGASGILLRGDQSVSFFVHPTFASFQTHEYDVRVTVRRVAPGNVGMNLFYEVADSQGRTPYRNRGQWFGLSPEMGWQTHTWHVADACFSKMWGYDISIRPEQSVPFVIGKVEVIQGK